MLKTIFIRSERLADGETDEAGARVVARDEQQDDQHHHQLDADQQHTDAHPGAERDLITGIRLAPKAGECSPRVGKGVDPDAEPGDRIAARDADQAEEQDDRDLGRRKASHHGAGGIGGLREEAEVDGGNRPDEDPEQHQELALREQIGLTGLVDELRHLAHRLVHRESLELAVDHQAEEQPERADHEPREQERMTRDPRREELYRVEVGNLETSFAAAVVRRFLGGRGDREQARQREKDRRPSLHRESPD
jgi:hypothetical protein